MSLPVAILFVALAGGLGALLRYALSFWQGSIPWGILAANSIGSLIAGLGVASGNYLLVVGLAGGLSTFSTFAAQAHALWLGQKPLLALRYLLLNLVIPALGFLTGTILL
jgi:fluoride exporter